MDRLLTELNSVMDKILMPLGVDTVCSKRAKQHEQGLRSRKILGILEKFPRGEDYTESKYIIDIQVVKIVN